MTDGKDHLREYLEEILGIDVLEFADERERRLERVEEKLGDALRVIVEARNAARFMPGSTLVATIRNFDQKWPTNG